MHWNCQQAKTAGKSACHILAPRMVTFLNNSMADLNQQCKKLLSNLLLERFVILVTWLHTGNPWLLFGTKDYYKLTFWKCGLWLAKSRVFISRVFQTFALFDDMLHCIIKRLVPVPSSSPKITNSWNPNAGQSRSRGFWAMVSNQCIKFVEEQQRWWPAYMITDQ